MNKQTSELGTAFVQMIEVDHVASLMQEAQERVEASFILADLLQVIEMHHPRGLA